MFIIGFVIFQEVTIPVDIKIMWKCKQRSKKKEEKNVEKKKRNKKA